MYHVPHFIHGQCVRSSGEVFKIYNPATGHVIGEINSADNNLIENVISSAKIAFLEWSHTTPIWRSRILFKFKELLEKYRDDLANLITQEHGKTLSDARGSIQRGIDVVEFVCGIPNLLKGSYSENVATHMDSYSVRQPLGVCLGITPFNFPAMIPLWMFPMAIACGNTFILKPSEKDPSCSIRLAELASEAGLPDGVLNVIQGDKKTVESLLLHPDIKAVSFVGSTLAAEFVYKLSTQQNKRVQAFGGAKNHCVVLPDANLDQVADAIVGAAYGSAGERCMAISVVVTVGEQVANTLIEKMKPLIKNLKIGLGTQSEIEMGPLITKEHWNKVESYIELGIKEGAKLIVDGRDIPLIKTSNGFFIGGSLFDDVKPEMRIYKEEIFGPVLVMVRVEDLDAALKLINEHEFGNGASIFTQDGNIARTFADKVQVGMVGVNVPIPVPVAYHSFGGWKRSMFGDIHMHGTEGVQFYTKLKTVTQRWVYQDINFNMP